MDDILSMLDPDLLENLDWDALLGDLNLDFDPSLISEPFGSEPFNMDDWGWVSDLVSEPPDTSMAVDPYDPYAPYTGSSSGGRSGGGSGDSSDSGGALGRLLKAAGGILGSGGGDGGSLGIGMGGLNIPPPAGLPNLPIGGNLAGVDAAAGINVPDMPTPSIPLRGVEMTGMDIAPSAPTPMMQMPPMELGEFTPMAANVPLPQTTDPRSGLARLLGIR